MPYADPAKQRAYERDWMRRRRAADPTLKQRSAEQMRERYAADPEHRERLLERMAARRARLKARRAAIRAALARIPGVRAQQRPAAPILRSGLPVHDPAAWCAAGLFADADVTAVMHAEDPHYAQADLWGRVRKADR